VTLFSNALCINVTSTTVYYCCCHVTTTNTTTIVRLLQLPYHLLNFVTYICVVFSNRLDTVAGHLEKMSISLCYIHPGIHQAPQPLSTSSVSTLMLTRKLTLSRITFPCLSQSWNGSLSFRQVICCSSLQ